MSVKFIAFFVTSGTKTSCAKNGGLIIKQIWEDAKEILKEKIPNNTFEPWILPIIPAKNNEECFKKDHIVLKSDKSFGVSFLNQKYFNEIQNAVNSVCGANLPVNIIFMPSDVKKAPKKKEKPAEHIVLMKEIL